MLKVNVSKINEDPIVQLGISIFVLTFFRPKIFLKIASEVWIKKLKPKWGGGGGGGIEKCAKPH
jgi:hypothetical protein